MNKKNIFIGFIIGWISSIIFNNLNLIKKNKKNLKIEWSGNFSLNKNNGNREKNDRVKKHK